MVEKIAESVFETVEISFNFNEELLREVISYLSELQNEITFESNTYKFKTIKDLEENIGLFDFNNWEMENFRGSSIDCISIKLAGNKLRIYLTNKNSEKQINFLGKIKRFIDRNTVKRSNSVQIINESIITTNSTNSIPTYFERNPGTIKLITISVLGGAAATVLGTYLLKLLGL